MEKKILIVILFLISCNCSKLLSQEYKEVLYNVNFGYTFEMFSSPSTPFTASFEMRKRKGNLFSWVSGLAFNYTDNDRVEGFFSRSEVHVYYTHLYGGVRFYASKRSSKHQFYGGANLGLGAAYLVEGPISNEESGTAFLGNCNINIGTILRNRFIITPSIDVALNSNEVGYIFYNFKVGYQFGK